MFRRLATILLMIFLVTPTSLWAGPCCCQTRQAQQNSTTAVQSVESSSEHADLPACCRQPLAALKARSPALPQAKTEQLSSPCECLAKWAAQKATHANSFRADRETQLSLALQFLVIPDSQEFISTTPTVQTVGAFRDFSTHQTGSANVLFCRSLT